MPTYNYKCQNCGFEFEKFQSIAAHPLRKCPSCEGEVQRQITGGMGFILKGTGFYNTDYKNKKSQVPPKKNVTPAPTKSETNK